MTGIVKEIGRSFLVSSFLPAVVFISLSKQLFFPVFFDGCQPFDFLVHSNFEQTIALVAVASAFVGYLLWSLNPQLVKLFEGYYFQTLLWPCEKYHNWRRTRILDEADEACRQYAKEQDGELLWYRKNQFITKQVRLETLYPLEGDVMPTAVGNVFRAFERYPGRRYGIDAVLFWPHLTSAIPSEFAQVVEEANNALTFLLTSCLMCGLLGIESLGAMLKLILCPVMPYVLDGSRFETLTARLSEHRFYGIFAICAFVLALAFKSGALKTSISIGKLVKSCFDLFRLNLLENMAGETALEDEWRAWARLRRSILVDKSAWLPEWEEDEEQEKVQNVDRPASRSCLDRALISGLTVAFLVKDVFCEGRSVSSRSDSRKGYVVLAQ